jgi:putative PIN family toxin of toxin-antitoxin system
MKVERVVLDTNVLISAALVRDSVPARVIRWTVENALLLFSPETFAELESRLWRPKFDRYIGMEQRHALLNDLAAIAEWVSAYPSHSRDPDDDKFIHLALAGGAQWLISGDDDLLGIETLTGLKILTPAQALRQIYDPNDQ